jgi:tape measure domain-containing protein
MAAVTTELKVLVKAVGKGEVDKLSKSLNDLGSKAAAPANRQFRELSVELKKIQRNSTQSIANLRGYRNAWRDISEQVKIGSREFKVATENAKRLDAQLQKAQGRGAPTGFLGRIGGIKGAAKGVGAIAAGGVFGGFEGAAGAGIGLAAGGPAGAAVGAAIGAQVGGIRQALGATAEYSANLDKLRIALKGVTTSSEEYQQGLSFVQESTERFAIPQEILTRQFTKLQASVQGAGGNLDDTKTAFNGIVAAVRATGGSLSDVDAALTATAQVFSKGKVSAEELRQQIGERLPGAFTLFAESMGLTPAELDKALEQGKVSLQDFQGFAKAIFDRYGKNAEAIAKSPKAAGDQLQVELQKLQESVGRLLQPIGAFFQEIFGSIVRDITRATNALARFLNLSFDAGKLAAAETRFRTAQAVLDNPAATTRERQRALRSREEARKVIDRQIRLRDAGVVDVQQPEAAGGFAPLTLEGGGADGGGRTPADTSERMVELQGRLGEALQDQNAELVAQTQYLIRNEGIALKFEEGKITALKRSELLEKSRNQLIKDGIRLRKQAKNGEVEFNEELTKSQQLLNSIKDTVAQGLTNAIMGLVDGTKSLGESLSGILRQLGSMFLNAGFKSLFNFADGGVFQQGKVTPFAYGGVVNKPTLFPMANGAGLMGEAGPEAIMPLRRDRSGRLGVEAVSGGVGNVVVNVDASGSSVEGDAQGANQLGKAIGIAVQAELVKQKRPGGLLA